MLSEPCTRYWSIKTWEKMGMTIPGTTSARLASTTKASAHSEPRSRQRMAARRLGLLPPFWKSGPGSKVSTTPV
jgi:hypothetical protein